MLDLSTVRLLSVLLALGSLGLLVHRRALVARCVRQFFWEPASPVPLALLRVYIFWLLFERGRSGLAAYYATLPPELLGLPYGWRWLRGVLPLDPVTVKAAEQLLVLTSGLSMVGCFARVSMPVAALLAVYVFGIPNFYLKIDHGSHVVILSALILAASPAADAVSIDRSLARWRGVGPPSHSPAYAIPLRFCWLTLGTSYLFPGLWKLWQAGDLWLTGAKVKAELYSRWAQLDGFTPLFRLDEHPWALSLFGVWTLIFEIGFIFALFHRGSRVIGALSAVGFHLGVALIMGIKFNAYLPLMLLLDWPGLRPSVMRVPLLRGVLKAGFGPSLQGRVTRLFQPPTKPAPPRSATAPLVLGSAIVLAMCGAGIAPIDSWPIAIFPRFDSRSTGLKQVGSKLQIVVKRADAERPLQIKLGSARLVRLMTKLKSTKNAAAFAKQARTLQGLFAASQVPLQPGDEVRVYRLQWKLFPLGEQRGLSRQLEQRLSVTSDLGLRSL